MGGGARRYELRHDRGATRLAVVERAADLAAEVGDWVADRAVYLVSSRPVLELEGARALDALAGVARRWQVLEVPDGEAAKDLEVAADVWRRLVEGGARRDSRLLTFGGGSVCDLGAFVAATYMRGIEFSHLPTTLLAQVDAAIGGKGAINLPAGKNLVGVFQHPERVVAATDLLATMPRRQLTAGLVEVIKMAALLDLELLASVERELEGLLAEPGGRPWLGIVAAAQRAKAAVVGRDPREAGERRVLNFGHTLAHALEAEAGYGALPHGEAVAHGLRFALQLAAGRGLDPEFGARLEGLLDRLSIPPLPALDVDRLLSLLERDKKAGAEGLVWVLPTAAGRWQAARVPASDVAPALAAFVARRGVGC